MKSPPIDAVVYNHMFPKPKTTDPQNFQSLLQRYLVPEVRLETQAFYGHLSSQEAKYPGLDYSHKPHRIRLSRFPWHRRLFRAFDNLGLTRGEIAGLTKWEGTRWAKERFEKEQGIVIRDTTADGIDEWVEHDLRISIPQPAQRADVEDMGDLVEDDNQGEGEGDDLGDSIETEPEEESDSEMQSVGAELNERLRAAVAQREAGDSTATMDEAWEKWLNERMESGESLTPYPTQPALSPNAHIPDTRPARGINDPAMFSRWIDAGRAGQWNEIPSMVHSFVRQEVESAPHRTRASSLSSAPRTLSERASPASSSSSISSRLPSIHDVLATHGPSSTTRSDEPQTLSFNVETRQVRPSFGEWRANRASNRSHMLSVPPVGSLARHRMLFGRDPTS